MLDILEIPEIRRQFVPLSVSEYEELCSREPDKYVKTELFRGVVINKMTKSSKHNYFKNIFTEEIRNILPAGFFVQNENSISLQDSDLEPDISVIAGNQRDYRTEKPSTARLIVEIAVSSIVYDRNKSTDYSKAGVNEYWIADIDSETLEVYSEPTETGYLEKKVFRREDSLELFGKKILLEKIFG